MYPFIESIKYSNGKYYLPEFHQERFYRTREKYYPGKQVIDLSQVLVPPADLLKDKVYKCRVSYGECIGEIVYEEYSPKSISQFYLISCPDEFDYSSKFADRSFFAKAKSNLKENEDYIYIKRGLITDCSFANLVFGDGEKLFTPSTPLLEGVKRAFYLKQGIIIETEIKVKDLARFKDVFIINAMLDLDLSHGFSCDKLLLSHNFLKI